MTEQQVRSERLQNLGVSRPLFRSPAELLEWLGGMQAQDYAGVKWSIGLRIPELNDAEIENSIERGELIRSWVYRGTLHLVASKDAYWLNKFFAERLKAIAINHIRKAGLTENILKKTNRIILKLLEEKEFFTRDDLTEALGRKKVFTEGHQLSHILQQATFEGILCFGPRIKKEYSFTSLDTWVKHKPEFTAEEALLLLTEKYFQSHGPATLADFAWWTGLTLTDCKKGIDSCKKIKRNMLNGEEYLSIGDVSAKNTASLHLLPGFDEYMLGYNNRSAFIDPEHFKVVYGTKNGQYASTIVINGKVAGTWRRNLVKDKVELSYKFFDKITAAQEKVLKSKIKAYARFIGKELA